MGGSSKSEAFVTLATNDTYCQGAVVLAHSLRCHNTKKDIVVMITPQVSIETKLSLQEYFDDIIVVNVLDSEDATHLALLKRPELGVTFTKIHCWDLTQYDKCVFMDADTMVLTNIDELFEREELSAAADSGWPDIFNSGVFVFKPSKQTYKEIVELGESTGSFDGGDQGLLNTYFSDWRTADINKHLSFLYNMQCTSSYTYLPAFARFGKDTKVVHFIGQVKPWHHQYDGYTGDIQQTPGPGIQEMKFLRQWWKQYTETSLFKKKNPAPIEQNIPPVPVHSTAPENLAAPEQSDPQPETNPEVTQEELERLKIEEQKANHLLWRSSQVDYTGADCFDNIQAKLDAVLCPEDSSMENQEEPGDGEKQHPDEEVPTTGRNEDSKSEVEDQNKEPPKDFVGYNRWADGAMDYAGKDSFSNIQSKLDRILNLDVNTLEDTSDGNSPLNDKTEDKISPLKLPEDGIPLLATSLESSLVITPTVSTRTTSPSVPLRGILRVRTPEPILSPEEK